MINVQGGNLVLLLSQYENHRLEQLDHPKDHEIPGVFAEFHHLPWVDVVFGASPSAFVGSPTVDGPLDEEQAGDHLEDIVAADEASKLERLSVLHEPRSEAKDEEQVENKSQQ